MDEENLFENDISSRRRALDTINAQFNLRNLLQKLSFGEWQRIHPIGLVISTREGMHQELLEVYGGGYESDGDEYNTDEEGKEKE
jgi:hypothetical protein